MGVGIAAKLDDGIGTLANSGGQPDLADAALDLVFVDPEFIGERRQCLAELDDVAIAVLPLVEEGKIVADFLNRLRPFSRI